MNDIEHWDYVEKLEYGYLLGCATKYVFRNRHKGSKEKDLNKVIQYCEKFIKSFKKKNNNKTFIIAFSLFDRLKDLEEYEKNLLSRIDTLSRCVSKEQCEYIMNLIREEIEIELEKS